MPLQASGRRCAVLAICSVRTILGLRIPAESHFSTEATAHTKRTDAATVTICDIGKGISCNATVPAIAAIPAVVRQRVSDAITTVSAIPTIAASSGNSYALPILDRHRGIAAMASDSTISTITTVGISIGTLTTIAADATISSRDEKGVRAQCNTLDAVVAVTSSLSIST